ncbi:hypothetical protein WN55_09552 [Dufourea novaeangliae]|uniref:Uncharacterized protein n=1 Tax=Dufourea novaeangliae TaxID=178035 RepID=A0A154NYQ4_DUFNO|nr:hypothetical protein WN55_09552 [Dufourea novaeangliae]
MTPTEEEKIDLGRVVNDACPFPVISSRSSRWKMTRTRDRKIFIKEGTKLHVAVGGGKNDDGRGCVGSPFGTISFL